MKRKLNKRAVALLVCLAVLVTVAVGATLALLIAGAEQLQNIFTPANVAVEVLSDTNGVVVRNTGNTSAFIRVALVVTWKDEEGNVWIEAPEYTLTGGTGWMEKDGFLYYTDAVAAGEATAALPEKIVLDPNSTPPSGYSLSVEILAAGIQSTPETVAEQEWGVTVENGKITG